MYQYSSFHGINNVYILVKNIFKLKGLISLQSYNYNIKNIFNKTVTVTQIHV